MASAKSTKSVAACLILLHQTNRDGNQTPGIFSTQKMPQTVLQMVADLLDRLSQNTSLIVFSIQKTSKVVLQMVADLSDRLSQNTDHPPKNVYYRQPKGDQFDTISLAAKLPETFKNTIVREGRTMSDELVIWTLAWIMHEEWREGWRKVHGDESREKDTRDQVWIEARETTRVDIAHTTFDHLPSDWQEENLRSAFAAVVIVRALSPLGVRLLTPAVLDMASSLLHLNWLGRNFAWATDHQKGSFADLSEEEMEKDRRIIRLAYTLCILFRQER
jgi:hypothetical protein